MPLCRTYTFFKDVHVDSFDISFILLLSRCNHFSLLQLDNSGIFIILLLLRTILTINEQLARADISSISLFERSSSTNDIHFDSADIFVILFVFKHKLASDEQLDSADISTILL